MNKRQYLLTALLLALFFSKNVVYCQAENTINYYNISDENGTEVYATGWHVQVGDQCLTEHNKRYEIVSVNGYAATAKFVGDVNLAQYLPASPSSLQAFFTQLLQPGIAAAQNNGKVAIYHTHSDESYVPTDGKESILGAGGIYKVGDAFTTALQNKGIEVTHSMAKHDPHDDMAYERSRRTVAELLKQQPDAIFDVHRDSVPPEVYKANINGQEVSKVQLVVGKYGPTGKQIEDYAMKIKAVADSQHPGLIKGIFFAKGGDYNQDLHPRSMLLEVGAHTNDRPSAEKGIALFADVVPNILGATSGTTTNPNGAWGMGTSQSGAAGTTKSIAWIVGLLIAGTVAFLFLSTGSVKEARAKLKQFTTTEFTNFFGPKSKKKK